MRVLKSNVGVILLAAGNSERMGRCKFLLPMKNGLSFFENIIQTFSDLGVKKIVVVTQVKHLETLKRLCRENKTQPAFVLNDFPERDRFYSLQLGIKAIGDVDYCFIHNSDCPFIDISTLHALVLSKNKADCICPEFNGKGGHPILLNKMTLQHLLNSPENAILKEELSMTSRFNVPVDNQFITVDIDTPDDYTRYFN